MTTIQKLHAIEKEKIIYAILYRRAGVAFQFYMGSPTAEDFHKDLTIWRYYPTFEEAVNAEYEMLTAPPKSAERKADE